MNKKGFAITGFIYTILIIFIGLLIAILALLSSRKNILDKLKEKVRGEINVTSSVAYDPFTQTGDIIEFSAKAQGYYSFELYSPKLGNVNGSKVSFTTFLTTGEKLYFLIGSNSYNNGTTEIRKEKNNSNSYIAKVSYDNYSIADIYNNRKILNKKIENNVVSTQSGKIIVNYDNQTRKNNNLNKVKYIKDCVSGPSFDWSEIQAIVSGENIALGKKVTDESNNILSNITDNSIDTFSSLTSNKKQCVVVDLGRTYNIDYLLVSHKNNKLYYGSETYVSTDGNTYNLIRNLEKKENENGLVVSSFEEPQVKKVGNIYVPVKEFEGAIWLRVFHHNNLNGTVLWDAAAQVLDKEVDELHKQSILYNLDNYKNINGNFEFLLEYSNIEGYNRWTQTSNPVKTKESVLGYSAISISWNQNNWKGLAKSDSIYTAIDGSVGSSKWYYAIGAIKEVDSGIYANDKITGEIVDLWVRIDNVN